MKVCVQGLWHLGSVTAGCLASVGHEVIGLDPNSNTIKALNQGKAPLFEPELDVLLKKGIEAERLRFTTGVKEAVREAQILWVAFDTPVDDNDHADVDYVVDQIRAALPHLSAGALVLVSSQMPVGSIRKLEKIAETIVPQNQLKFAYSPENLRLGKAIDVFLKPDRIVVGYRTDEDKTILNELLSPITDLIEWMSVESAEMTKHAINAFLATSVTFANEVASICELVGADAKEVERGLKSENRIGPKAYLSPGGAFAGGTLARDISFLNKIANDRVLQTPLLSSVKISNDEHKKWARRRLNDCFPALAGTGIAVWGLTYKPETDTLRRSMSVELCNWLINKGVRLKIHDPAVKELPAKWNKKVERSDSALEAIRDVKALIVATEWAEYRDISVEDVAAINSDLIILDANRFLKTFTETDSFTYLAVGTSHKKGE